MQYSCKYDMYIYSIIQNAHTFSNPTCTLSNPTCTLSNPKCTLNNPTCILSNLTCTLSNPTCTLSNPTCTLNNPTCTHTSTSVLHSISFCLKCFICLFSLIVNSLCFSSIVCSDWTCLSHLSCVHNHTVHRCTCTCSGDTEILYNQ